MRRRGFTWSELLVVLAVVIILAAIFSAVITSSRKRWRRERGNCSQNVRQIGLALKQYLSDYDESFPPVSSGGTCHGWADGAQPYIRNSRVFQCPYDDIDPMSTDGPATPNYSDYFYNFHLARQNESALKYIANIIMLGDAVPGDARQHSTGGTSKTPGPASLVNRYGVSVGAARRHLDGAYYCFADGHVKWLKGTDDITCPAIRNAASGATSKYPTFAID